MIELLGFKVQLQPAKKEAARPMHTFFFNYTGMYSLSVLQSINGSASLCLGIRCSVIFVTGTLNITCYRTSA